MDYYERRVFLPQHLIGNAPLFPCAALGRLNKDMRILDHAEKHLAPLCRGYVQRHHALVAAFGGPELIAKLAQHVPYLGAFYLYDVRALLGKHRAYKRAGDNGR